MKASATAISLALTLFSGSLLAADTGIQVTTHTNYAGVSNSVASKMDIFTRDGKTNLVCDTRTKDGVLLARIHSFYHDNLKIGESIETPDVQDLVAKSNSPYSLCYRARSLHDAGFVYVRLNDWTYVDIFTCTNGVYYPGDRRILGEINAALKGALKQWDYSSELTQ